eukprot:754270-Hanusia_phi.AAC.2
MPRGKGDAEREGQENFLPPLSSCSESSIPTQLAQFQDFLLDLSSSSSSSSSSLPPGTKTLPWTLRDLGEELNEEVQEQLVEGKEVTPALLLDALRARAQLAGEEGLGKTHWSVLRMYAAAGQLLVALQDEESAARCLRFLLRHSVDIRELGLEHRYRARLGMALHAAALRKEEEEEEEDGGREEERNGKSDFGEEILRLEMEAIGELTRAMAEVEELLGQEHWAWRRLKQEKDEALAATIARRARKRVKT